MRDLIITLAKAAKSDEERLRASQKVMGSGTNPVNPIHKTDLRSRTICDPYCGGGLRFE